jgi:hydrogenase nickel incorporation protein HypA/HybF
MHELTVAIQIRRALEAELESEAELLVADAVRIQVGALSGVVPEALQFAWPHAIADSRALGGARLDIDRIDVQLHCEVCDQVHVLPELTSLRCPSCRSVEVHVIAGDELDIASVDLGQSIRERS